MPSNIVSHRGWLLPLPVPDLARVRRRTTIEPSDEDVVDLVLDQVAIELGAVGEGERLRQRTVDPHLFTQPAAGRLRGRLARPRMTAAGVRPEARRVILPGRALLEEQAAALVEDKDGKRPVQLPPAM